MRNGQRGPFGIASIAYAYVSVWSVLPGVWKWVVLGVLVYSAVTTPLTLWQILRLYWNAPEAARRNSTFDRHAAVR